MKYNGTGDQTWGTPEWVIKAIEEFLGREFTLDVCAEEGNQKCELFYDKKQNGLAQDWTTGSEYDLIWCNPPYGQGEVLKWLRKAKEEYVQNWGVKDWRCVMLLNADTSTQWFHSGVEPLVRRCAATKGFIEGRVNFIAPPGVKRSSNQNSQMILALGDTSSCGAREIAAAVSRARPNRRPSLPDIWDMGPLLEGEK